MTTALLGVCVAATTSCGSPAPALVAAPGVKATDCGTVTVAMNPWVGYEANAAVFSYLARTELGCTVTLKEEPEAESWKHVADGSVDVILENWGHDDLKKKYIDQSRTVVEAGLTGNKGVIGWYIPPWMLEEYPDIASVEGLKKYERLFRTSESGSQGQFLGGDPSYVTNDAALLKNLGLDYTVVYSGNEDKSIAAFREAEKERKPLLGYFYSPQWFLSEVPLAHIPLPAYKPGCDADPKTVKCDYQPFDLDKIVNAAFATSGSPAAELVKNFRWTNEDQNQVARSLTEGLTPDQAAKKWLDTHPATWRPWLPSPA